MDDVDLGRAASRCPTCAWAASPAANVYPNGSTAEIVGRALLDERARATTRPLG